MNLRILFILACIGLATGVAQASTTSYSGYVNDMTNTALVYSDLGNADSTDTANNVALYHFTVAAAGNVSFVSTGYAAGGIDPYFTLFQGSDINATFLGSNYDQAFSTGGDFNLSYTLAAGNYIFTLGTFANMSFAENLGSGSLGDGFIFLGEPSSLGNNYYNLAVTTPDHVAPVPEPSSLLLLGAGLAASMVAYRKKMRR